MNKKKTTIKLFSDLWKSLTSRRRKQFILLILLVIAASVSEVLSIGSVLPFLSVLTEPEKIYQLKFLAPILKLLSIESPTEIVLPVTLIFIFFALTAGIIRLLLIWASTKLSYATGTDISIEIYRRTLYQPYIVHISRNSSEVVSTIIGKSVKLVVGMILPQITLVSSTIIILSVLVVIISIDPVISFYAFVGFIIMYGFVAVYTKKKLEKNAKVISNEYSNVFKVLQEGMGGIRDVLLDGSQDIYCKIYKVPEYKLKTAYASTTFISSSPRFIMESLGMVFIAMFAYLYFRNTKAKFSEIIPMLGVLAVGAQRMLPIFQQAYQAFSSIRSHKVLLEDVLKLLEQPIPKYALNPIKEPMQFNKAISLTKLEFRYSKELPLVLNSIDIKIKKGETVGFIGPTGSGKSTLLDIIMGLLEPSIGNLYIDDTKIDQLNIRNWQMNIAHVPQFIFLSDGTIAENIAFGEQADQINMERVSFAAKQACISNFIENSENGYQTVVGERGVRLSGGQKQRIGIARAFYKKASVFIFDEATSALDNETEEAVMRSIGAIGKNVTVLLIAHRITTLKNCDYIVELTNGSIARKVSYQEFVST